MWHISNVYKCDTNQLSIWHILTYDAAQCDECESDQNKLWMWHICTISIWHLFNMV